MPAIRVPSRSRFIAQQRGAVLFVALMLLILISLMAITSSGTAVLEEQMTGAMRNQQLSLMAGETTLRAAEARLWSASASGAPILACSTTDTALFGVYCYNPDASRDRIRAFRTTSDPQQFVADSAAGISLASTGLNLAAPQASDATARVDTTPYYVVEDLGEETPPNSDASREYRSGGSPSSRSKHLYRITARSVGGTSSVMRIVESTFVSEVK